MTFVEVSRTGNLRRGTRRDLSLLVVVVGSVLVATSLPYLFGYLSAPPGEQFMGVLLNVPDTAQYLSWLREFRHALLVENMLTPEHGSAVFFNLFWLGVARLGVALRLDLMQSFQVARLAAGAFYLGAIYWFAGLVARDRLHHWVSFLVVSLGGGLGWILVVLKQFSGQQPFPLDIYVYEPNSFVTTMAFPHQAMAGGLLLLILGISALAFERNSLRLASLAGLLGLALGLQHGYDLLIVYAVVGLTAAVLVLRTRAWVQTAVMCGAICGPSVPAALYLEYITRESPIWRGVLAQYGNAGVYTPPPAHLLVLMGLPLILLLIRRRVSEDAALLTPRELILRSWLVAGLFLLYIPADFQIKMLGGWQVPAGILASRVVLDDISPGLRGMRYLHGKRSGVVIGTLLILAVLPANIYLYSWRFVDLARHDYPYYLDRNEVAGLRWLEGDSQPSDVVLSSLTIGQYVPAIAGDHAFLAHWAETLDFYQKQAMVNRFFDAGTPDLERRRILSQFGVTYVFYGPAERSLGRFDPGSAGYLQLSFDSNDTRVYRVRRPASAGHPAPAGRSV